MPLTHEKPKRPPRLCTAKVIAEQLGAKLGRVQRVLATRHHIRPVVYADRKPVYHYEAVAQVRYELNLIDAKRGTRPTDCREVAGG